MHETQAGESMHSSNNFNGGNERRGDFISAQLWRLVQSSVPVSSDCQALPHLKSRGSGTSLVFWGLLNMRL